MRFLAWASIAFSTACGGTACGSSTPPPEPPKAAAPVAAVPAPEAPPCSNAPVNPAEAIGKEPGVFNACFVNGAAKLDGNLCGNAKIAVEIGKDGRVSRAEVASSTLPTAVTDCLKARLAAMQFACPGEGTATYSVPFGLPIGSPTGACPGLAPG